MSEPCPPRATYLLPMRWADASEIKALAEYLRSLPLLEIIVVDASDEAVFAGMESALAGCAIHVRPHPHISGSNGKARGVLTGLELASCDKVIVADDDVRYDTRSLDAVLERLDHNDCVRPQNFFAPPRWHAVYDGARSLINRAIDGDWPGTVAFRRAALPRGYNADVLFENFELVQTIRRNGGTQCTARDVFVRRLPPSTAHFWSQRVRQAYDEFARPIRMLAALCIVPFFVYAATTGQYWPAAAIALLAMATAGIGWLRQGAFRYFSPLSVLCAPFWVVERGLCAWLALYTRVRHGGVRYAGTVVRRAASRGEEPVRWAA